MHKRKLLLIVYRFPPMGGVGSRRWVKFCKYLCALGWEVHVLTIKYPWVDKVNWSKELNNLQNLKVTQIPSGYPSILLRPKSELTLLQRLVWGPTRVVYAILSRITRSVDHASFFGKALIPYAANYAKKYDINTVVFTGPPSSLHLCGAILKSENPDLRLIQDYRDPWNNVHDHSISRKVLGLAHKADMMSWERISLDCADHIVVVTERMKYQLHRLFGISLARITVIRNGFDPDDRPVHFKLATSEKITLIYAGTLGRWTNSRLVGLELLIAVIGQLEPEVKARFRVEIYSDIREGQLSARLRESKNLLYLKPMISNVELFERIQAADVCLSINAEKDSYAVGTKVYDYMGLQKSIFHLAPGGELSELLTKAGQYVATYDEHSIEKCLLRIVSDKINGLLGSPRNYSDFSVIESVARYDTLLKQ